MNIATFAVCCALVPVLSKLILCTQLSARSRSDRPPGVHLRFVLFTAVAYESCLPGIKELWPSPLSAQHSRHRATRKLENLSTAISNRDNVSVDAYVYHKALHINMLTRDTAMIFVLVLSLIIYGLQRLSDNNSFWYCRHPLPTADHPVFGKYKYRTLLVCLVSKRIERETKCRFTHQLSSLLSIKGTDCAHCHVPKISKPDKWA